ncbi:hypothetical protein GGI25_002101 [Coemansia spiralis]|uniref:CST complex subunit STN1 n=2 Tax=Coemansia TaxID=4863 RepID=A0A9W8KZC6_9FUNG|nr:hypothetical protein BX070DRAFT_232339 [Coemansia spiralis]KAJ1995181.1 hypothetical protein EDC05_001019 [Coemansia umbellata]KAJ2625582.1 hypothetical protein GGI26_000382 [Coemansia sp. RSA 1358]KAJ2678716.1 hypothetical protein GGI25_002101 [Coemansia spiralis]
MNLENKASRKPAQEWGLDPLFWTNVKLFVGDLHHVLLNETGSVLFIGDQRVVRTVEIVGIVVSVDKHLAKMTVYNVDDGTGVIPCVEFTTQEEQTDPDVRKTHALGTTVCVEGRLSTFRDMRELVTRNIRAVDPNEEALGWLERLKLRNYIMQSPVQT